MATKFGDVTVEEAPRRVVALGWGDAEVALSLGVEPIAAADWLSFGGDGVGPWVEHGYTQSPEILGTTDVNYEAVAALEPDLILDVRSSGDQERYDMLSAIAPVIGVSAGGDKYKTSRDEQLTMIGAALGKPAEAQEQIEQLQERISGIAADHPEWSGTTFAVLGRTATTWGAYNDGTNRADRLIELGFSLNPWVKSQSASAKNIPLSGETLSNADSEVVIAQAVSTDISTVETDPAWMGLPAVREGRAIVMPKELSQAFSLATAESTNYALDERVPLLEDIVPV